MNDYVVLGVDEDADRETIRRAFRGPVRRYPPDAGAGSSPDVFLRVVEAYETLNNPSVDGCTTAPYIPIEDAHLEWRAESSNHWATG